ncbi:unnamed protein product [Calicophoron daubneyi]|uniref:Cell division cycle protein 27 homolog n=1 Tax=Calicophoron daubneyi TaxID=300641 RepID=A0AAV2TIA7_CALDB
MNSFVGESEKSEFAEFLSHGRKAVDSLLNFRNQYINDVVEKYGLLAETDESWLKTCSVKAVIEEMSTLVANRSSAMKRAFDDTITTLKDMEPIFARARSSDKAEFCYLNGKALNFMQPDDIGRPGSDPDGDEYSTQAAQWLTRALKFNPQHAKAWCELGEARWRQNNPAEAADHFRHALKIDPTDVEALCQLSMVLRQLPSSPTSKPKSAENSTSDPGEKAGKIHPLSESLQLAHTAVRHRPTDGHAWSVLGNALLTTFFESFGSVSPLPSVERSSSVSSNHTSVPEEPITATMNGSGEHSPSKSSKSMTSSQVVMSRCLAAYAQAVKDKSTALEPNFHYNRGVAWHYQDMFAHALRSWLRAVCLDPQWPAPRNCALRLTNFLLAVDKGIQQISQEMTDTPISTDQPTRVLPQSDTPSNKPHRVRKEWGRVREIITPLAPCIPVMERTATKDSSSASDKSTTTKANEAGTPTHNTTSLSRLLGPYCPASGEGNPLWWSGGKGKKSRRRKPGTGRMPPANLFTTLSNPAHLQLVPFNSLKAGANQSSVCVGRVLSELPADSDLVLNLLLVDAYGTPLPVRLYNIGKGMGPVRKDILAIPNPFIEECTIPGSLISALLAMDAALSDLSAKKSLTSKLNNLDLDANDSVTTTSAQASNAAVGESEKSDSQDDLASGDLNIRVVRVPLPDVLVVNGRPVGGSWTAAPVLENIFFTAA